MITAARQALALGLVGLLAAPQALAAAGPAAAAPGSRAGGSPDRLTELVIARIPSRAHVESRLRLTGALAPPSEPARATQPADAAPVASTGGSTGAAVAMTAAGVGLFFLFLAQGSRQQDRRAAGEPTRTRDELVQFSLFAGSVGLIATGLVFLTARP